MKIISEFKEFALKGNMIDLAVGVVIGSSFNAVVTSIVNDIFMPIVGAIIGGKDFSNLSIKIGESVVKYGALIQNIVNFLIVAVCLFMVVKVMNALRRKKEEPEQEQKKPDDIVLLEEIRDALKKSQ